MRFVMEGVDDDTGDEIAKDVLDDLIVEFVQVTDMQCAERAGDIWLHLVDYGPTSAGLSRVISLDSLVAGCLGDDHFRLFEGDEENAPKALDVIAGRLEAAARQIRAFIGENYGDLAAPLGSIAKGP